jgi:peroxiredoxin Q/BCP
LQKYGAWGEKSMYGKKYMGVLRSTVLINPDGHVAEIWPKVKVKDHAEEVKTRLEELQANI